MGRPTSPCPTGTRLADADRTQRATDPPRARSGRLERRPAVPRRPAGAATGPGARGAAGERGPARRGATSSARPGAPRHAEGAGESGLARLIELHAFNAAGDAAVAISLAGTLFFQVPTDEARGQVALFLLLTMLPFAIVAPLIGPVLDRFSHGRRWAIGADDGGARVPVLGAGRARSPSESLAMFPAALGVLVASKAYGVTRAAAVPRRAARAARPGQGQLPHLAGRHHRRGDLGAARGAARPLAGPEWSLRYAFAGVRGRHDPGDPAAGEGRRRRGEERARSRVGRARPGCRRIGGARAALQRRAAAAVAAS